MTDQPQDPGQPPTPPAQPAPPAQPPVPQGQGQHPPYPPPAPNPYGGYATAPVYAPGGGPVLPGSKAWVEQRYGRVADFGQRVIALLIDGALTLIGVIPMLVSIPVLIAGAPARTGYDVDGYPVLQEPDTVLIGTGLALLGVGFLVMFGITIWNRIVRMGRTGQSVGKSVVGLRLIHAQTGYPIGPGSCFARELLSGVINQVVYLSYLWMLWDDNQQTLADKIVTSTVIVVPKR